jgi:hypothetical protein
VRTGQAVSCTLGFHRNGSSFMAPIPATPSLYSHSNDVQADAKRMAENGFILIGTSSFSGAANKVHESQAFEQAKKGRQSLCIAPWTSTARQ